MLFETSRPINELNLDTFGHGKLNPSLLDVKVKPDAQIQRYYVHIALCKSLLKQAFLVLGSHSNHVIRIEDLCCLVPRFGTQVNSLVNVGPLVHHECQPAKLPHFAEVWADGTKGTRGQARQISLLSLLVKHLFQVVEAVK